MPAVDPLTTIPEIAKVGIMICQVVELQSNSHKLATLKSAFTKITLLIVEADRLAPFQNSNDWMQIHNEAAEITTSYQKLLKWVGALNKAQRFVKFWEIRKEIHSLWEPSLLRVGESQAARAPARLPNFIPQTFPSTNLVKNTAPRVLLSSSASREI